MNRTNMKLLLLAVTGTLIFSASAQNGSAPFVTVEKVLPCRESIARTHVGAIVPREDVALIPRITGFIKNIHFKDGTMVKKGQLLFEFEDTAYVAKVKSCRAQLTQAKVQEDFATKEYLRSKRLREKDAVSITGHDNAVRA
ncbi:MAG: biotin/lipoyl-binding protein, partial [Lentisphaeria bacterium]|nr:biotin/lipoyl-binding protein [Lentisphaeria bacterium]